MARKEAFKILISSISFGETLATAQAIAACSIMGRNNFRLASDNCLESLSSGCLKLVGKITAAAKTGPA